MNEAHAAALIAVSAAVTIALRFLPFLVLRGRATPRLVTYLGKVLPYATMGMLVVYCLRDTRFDALASFAPQFISCALVAGTYIWKRNTLLSIVGGTVCYMILVQTVF